MNMKLISVVGTRPNFVKYAPLEVEFARVGIDPVLLHTGQHYDYEMNKIFFDQLNIPKPTYNLDVHGGSHTFQTANMMLKMEPIFQSEKPDAILVIGDVNSTLAAALVAKKMQIPLIHVESGLRSFDMSMPEEVNRIVTDHLSDLLFAPTETAVQNLHNEGIYGNIHLVGDPLTDVVLSAPTKSLNTPDEFILLTIHRQANTNSKERLSNIIRTLTKLDTPILFPCHPRTKNALTKFDLMNVIHNSNIQLIDPVGFFEMLYLEKHAKIIITDSGGVQREAAIFSKPCLVLRDHTEWIELVESGSSVLVGADPSKIVSALNNPPVVHAKPTLVKPGASKKIAEVVFDFLHRK